ncbi:endoplasmic reticulum metallopeptidase 1-like, partial [Rhincodon typus]|uniref:endoplasmic reticulum metallopeptidase 1-like n=1 Tax=Rhincodon typus TaxID=259920 RepID=UPI00202F66BE
MSAVTGEKSGLESGSRSRAVRIRGVGAKAAETQAASAEPVSWARARGWHRPGKGREDGVRTVGEVADAGASLLVAIYLLLLWVLIHLSLRQLVAVGPSQHRDGFDAKAARKHLQHITEFGPRPVGSPANEILTVNYLLKQIQEIKGKAVANNIVVDIQRPTGFFSIDFLGGFSSYYDNITNVVVKLEPKKGAKHAVLANCHFDSVANSP